VLYQGGQLHQLRGPYFRRQQSARAKYSTLKLIKSKYRSVLTDEHLTELVRTALSTYQPNLKKLTAIQNYINQIKYFVLQANKLLATDMDFGQDPLENKGKKKV
jgi:hypothetical protein